MKPFKLALVALIALFIAGCVSPTQESPPAPTTAQTSTPQTIPTTTSEPLIVPTTSTSIASPAIQPVAGTYSGTILAGKPSPLLDFTKTDYDAALKTDKIILLYFYATWCPICREEVPRLYAAFNELTTDRLVGFRVNYNDPDTDADEIQLAREFGVAYQHTKVILKNGQRILKAPETWDKEKYLTEINNAIG